jgi:tetratricopeptide (TPR) repeat protein
LTLLIDDTIGVALISRYIKICIALIIFSVSPYSIAFSGNPANINALLSSGDSLYRCFDYRGSAEYFRKAADLDSNSFNASWKLSRSLNFVGELAPEDSQLAVFESAAIAARHAIALDNESADAHFQLARALGKIALFKGVLKSVGLAKQVKTEAEKTLAIDSLHDGAWHILGRWNREVGKTPRLIRGPLGLGAANKEDAIAFMKKAIALRPAYINHHLEMGITFQEYDKKDLAREEFEICLALSPDGPLDNLYKEEARKHLAKIEGK